MSEIRVTTKYAVGDTVYSWQLLGNHATCPTCNNFIPDEDRMYQTVQVTSHTIKAIYLRVGENGCYYTYDLTDDPFNTREKEECLFHTAEEVEAEAKLHQEAP